MARMRVGAWAMLMGCVGCTFGTAGLSGSAGIGEDGGDGTASGGEGVTGSADVTSAGDHGTAPATQGADATATTGVETSTGDDASTGDESASATVGDEGPPEGCGDGRPGAGEGCDDANLDESDGCLSTCVVPRSCLHILGEIPSASDGTYTIVPDGGKLDVHCDMTTHGGGWTLVAKVNPADQDVPPDAEPVGWFDMTLSPAQLSTDELVDNAGLESHGAARFGPLLGEGSVARFELIAQADWNTTVDWYKRIAGPASFTQWFAADPMASQVCLDVDMMVGCSMGDIAVTSLTALDGMHMDDYGYQANTVIHMRLENDGDSYAGVCSDTNDNDGNAWPDDYAQHWGNGLRIWLRE